MSALFILLIFDAVKLKQDKQVGKNGTTDLENGLLRGVKTELTYRVK